MRLPLELTVGLGSQAGQLIDMSDLDRIMSRTSDTFHTYIDPRVHIISHLSKESLVALLTSTPGSFKARCN